MEQAAIYIKLGQRVGFLVNQHLLCQIRIAAGAQSAHLWLVPISSPDPDSPIVTTTVRWFDTAALPAGGMFGPSPGARIHETADYGLVEAAAFIEMLVPEWWHSTGPYHQTPLQINFTDCEAAAAKLRPDSPLWVLWRHPSDSTGRLHVSKAIFVSFTGKEPRSSCTRQTLKYRLVTPSGAYDCTDRGSCGSIILSEDCFLVGMHSCGPSSIPVWRTGRDGVVRACNLRDLVLTAELSTFEEYRKDQDDGLSPNSYEQAVSIYAIRDSFVRWGLHAS